MVILLGHTGYVGSAFTRLFQRQNIPFVGVSRKDLDYANSETLRIFLTESRPDFLICASGYTGRPNVDACEANKTACLLGNAVLPGVVRLACEQAGVPWGHVSSGCIYTGDKGIDSNGRRIGFKEEDLPNFSFRQNNCSFYSGTKALGEEVLGFGPHILGATTATLQPSANCYVWRLRIPFNEQNSPRNFLSKLINYARLLEATNSLSQLDEFAAASWECLVKQLPTGIYHVTNPGYVNTREVVALIKKSGISNKEFDFFTDETEFLRLAAQTPRSNCVLDTSKLASYGIRMTEVHEAIEIALRNWKASA